MLFSKNDIELLAELREGNKKVLLLFYKRYFRVVKIFIKHNGGTTSEASELLKEALAQLWTEVSDNTLVAPVKIQDYVLEKVRKLWLKRHNETEIRNFIQNKITVRFGTRQKIAFASGLLVFIFLASWWYFDFQPVNSEKIPDFFPSIVDSLTPAKKNYSNVNRSKIKSKKEFNEEDIVSGNDSLLSSDSAAVFLTENLDNDAKEDTLNLIKPDDFVVRKDELLYSRIVQVTDIGSGGKEKSITQETAEKLNPEAQLPSDEDSKSKSFIVEFWKSPVNYKGYKMGKNKIIFYGIEEPDWVKLYFLDENFYMEYGAVYYLLNQNPDFLTFSRIIDTSITSLLKK